MAKVQDVAQFFIGLANDQAKQDRGDLMTHLRLQKLLYFAQGWSLQRYGRPLFEEDMEAWRLGPVVRSIYNEYRDNGRSGLEGSMPDAGVFTEDEFLLLLDVAREYEKYGTGQLVDMTHEPGTPWDVVGERNVIPKDLIRDYFSRQEPLCAFSDDSLDDIYVPERGEDGIPIISGDFADGWDEED